MSNGTHRIRTNNSSHHCVRSADTTINAATKANARNGAASQANSAPFGVNARRIKQSNSMPLTPKAISTDQRHQIIPPDRQCRSTTAVGVFVSKAPKRRRSGARVSRVACSGLLGRNW